MAPNRSRRLLVVDDEDSIREVLTDFLTMEGYAVVALASGEAAAARLKTDVFDAILLDMKMPGMDGLELLDHIRCDAPNTFAVMMTGYGTVETAITAMKKGADDYILKPFKVQDVINLLERGLQRRELEAENIQLREAVQLYKVSEQMSSTLEPIEVQDILIDTTRAQLDADAVAIWAPLADGWECTRRWMRPSLDTSHAQLMASVDTVEVERRIHDGDPLILRHEESRALVSGDASAQLCALMCVPLRSYDDNVGFLVAFAFDEERSFVEGKRKMLSILGGRASAAIENAKLYTELQSSFMQTIQAFANLLEDKDPYTHGHSHRVSKYAVMIGTGLAMSPREIATLRNSALMHDIGKLGIRYEDLNKAEPLTEGEYEMFKSHTTRGKWMLEPVEFLHPLIPGVYHHHERWDGKGYPLGLKGEEIPLMGRILAIADTYDAMTSHRAYRRALPHDVAIREIIAFAGTQFDPNLVPIFVEAITADKQGKQAKAHRWSTLDDRPDDSGAPFLRERSEPSMAE